MAWLAVLPIPFHQPPTHHRYFSPGSVHPRKRRAYYVYRLWLNSAQYPIFWFFSLSNLASTPIFTQTLSIILLNQLP